MKVVLELNNPKLLEQKDVEAFLVGVKGLSLRASETYDDLEPIIKKAHELNKKVFLNAMDVIMEKDVLVFFDLLKKVLTISFDGVFYTDFAVLEMLSKLNYQGLKCYFPTTYITNAKDRDLLLNFNDIVLASPEVSKGELKEIVNENTAVILFGELALFHSKRKLLSRYFEYRNFDEMYDSAKLDVPNYMIKEEFRQELYPVIEDDEGFHIFMEGYYTLMCDREILEKAGYGIILTSFLDYEDLSKVVASFIKYQNGFINKEELWHNLSNLKLPLKLSTGMLNQKTVLIKEENNV